MSNLLPHCCLEFDFQKVDQHAVWACMNYHVSVTHYKRPYDAKLAWNRSALGSVLATGASNRDFTLCCNNGTLLWPALLASI